MSTPLLDETVLSADRNRPLLLVNATIETLDPVIGEMTGADLMIVGAEIVCVGPGLHTAAEDDNSIVVDCTGLTIVPILSPSVSSLAPGNPATLAVVPSPSADDRAERVVRWPSQAAAIVVDGEFVLFNGVSRASFMPAAPSSNSPYVGMWINSTGFIHQELTAEGRYDEARGGRPHAYEGSYWIDGDRIVYRDDLGFWAYGRFIDGVLHHAGYTFTRQS
ncbi:Atu4866 domain-containing protein [Micromonospora rubida]|uniref:Atu4866 domain-containing protein n=1 Tax=Micromonospora rubida TaxID=2697657 RepID=A0ABW7SRI3_9ACTN